MLPSKTCSKHCAKPAALGVAKSTRTLSNFYLDGSLSLLLPDKDLPLAGVVRSEASPDSRSRRASSRLSSGPSLKGSRRALFPLLQYSVNPHEQRYRDLCLSCR